MTRPTLADRLDAEKAKVEALAAELKPGLERDDLLRKISQLDTEAHIDRWASSPGWKVRANATRRLLPADHLGTAGHRPSRR
jgi:hypothetical protein